MKIQEFKTSKGEFMAVLVPEDARLIGYLNETHWSYFSDSKGWGQFPVNGNYKIIGIKTEITEEQAKEIVDELAELIFKDYIPQTNGLGMSCFCTAFESFKSLMQKLEIKPDTKTLIIQKIK